MDRREFLAAGATAAAGAVGGCTGCAAAPTASLRMDAVADVEIARRLVESDPDRPPERRRLLRRAVGAGETTVRGTEPPLPDGWQFVLDGSIYRLDVAATESTPATSFSVTLNPADGEVSAAESVRFEDLPAVDRETFRERGWADPDFLGFGTTLVYLDGEIPESALVPEPERPVIVWDAETRGRFAVDGSHETAVKTFAVDATLLRESAAAFGRSVREAAAFRLSGLTAPERKIVEEAVDGGGYVVPPDESPPPAFRRLADRFRGRERVERDDEGRLGASGGTVPERSSEPDDGNDDADGVSGQYLVRYEGEVYWTDLRSPEATESATAG